MNQPKLSVRTALTVASTVLLLGLAQCSTNAPANPGTGVSAAELHFSLSKCQPIGSSLWKCPAVDKPICSPDYVGTDIQCVRIDRNGKVLVQQMEM